MDGKIFEPPSGPVKRATVISRPYGFFLVRENSFIINRNEKLSRLTARAFVRPGGEGGEARTLAYRDRPVRVRDGGNLAFAPDPNVKGRSEWTRWNITSWITTTRRTRAYRADRARTLKSPSIVRGRGRADNAENTAGQKGCTVFIYDRRAVHALYTVVVVLITARGRPWAADVRSLPAPP